MRKFGGFLMSMMVILMWAAVVYADTRPSPGPWPQ